MNFTLQEYAEAMPRLLIVRTQEEDRLIEDLQSVVPSQTGIFVWNTLFGVLPAGHYIDEFTELNAPTGDQFNNLPNLLRYIYQHTGPIPFGEEPDQEHSSAFYVLLDADQHLDADNIQRYLKQIAQSGIHHPDARRTVILVSQDGTIPTSLEPYVEYYEYKLPSGDELRELLQSYEDRARAWETEAAIEYAEQRRDGMLSEPEKRQIEEEFTPEFTLPTNREKESIPQSFIDACSGLTRYQIEEAIYSLFTVKGEVVERDLLQYRKQKVEKSDLLEFIEPSETFDDVAGLENQKEWLQEVGACFTDEGKEWGLVPPKGLLQVGVPGCGKSLTAKAVSNEWELPLVRFDTGRVFSSRVGDSERNMRRALDVIEGCAPCVLWVDEIEKGMSGVASSNRSDAGTTSRVIGTFLTWFEEHSEDIFLIATSNDISEIPSELVSRFDEVFFVDLPGKQAREECFRIHLSELWTEEMGDMEDIDFEKLAECSENFTGREIDQVVRESLRSGYEAGKMSTDVIVETLERKPPMILTMQEEIGYLLDWVGFDQETGQGIRARMASKESVLAERQTEE